MTSFLKTGILAAAFLIAFVLLVRQGPHDDRLHLWALELADLTQVTVGHEATPYTFVQEAGNWFVQEGDEKWQADAAKLAAWLQPLTHPHAKSLLGERPQAIADLKRYGLAPDPISITLKTQGGQTYQLLVGKPSPLQDNYYVQVAEKPTVYLFSRYALSPLLEPKWDFLKPSEQTAKDAATVPTP